MAFSPKAAVRSAVGLILWRVPIRISLALLGEREYSQSDDLVYWVGLAAVTDGPASLDIGFEYDLDRLRIEAGHSKQL
jgi:hypothetical protein